MRILLTLLLIGCTNPRTAPLTNTNDMTLNGTWHKQTKSDCGNRYPAQISFGDHNLYTAQADDNATVHPIWDMGTWSLRGNALTLSTANDANIDYAITLKNNVLTLKSPDGCTLEYAKK